MIKGSKHTEEQKKKISEGISKHLPSTTFKKGHIPWTKTHKFSLESRRKISEANKKRIPWNKNKHIVLNNALEIWRKNGGHNKTEIKKGQHLSLSTQFRKGQKLSEEIREKIGLARRGKRFSQEWKNKLSESHKGEKAYNWKNGISKDINKYSMERRHRLGISKRFRKDIRGFSKKYHHQKRKAMEKGGGELLLQTIQRVYEDNIKKYGTLTCYLCLQPIPFGKDHLEHKVPLSRSGTNEYGNLAIACQGCNCKKHTKTETEYRKEIFLL